MNSAVTKKEAYFVTVDEYLAKYALDSDYRYELIDGDVVMTGSASKEHNRVAGNIFAHATFHLKGKPCKPYIETLRVMVNDNAYFPDMLVDCGESRDRFTATLPVLIVEVLSPSTRRIDKTVKLRDYVKIPSLQEYAIFEQDIAELTLYRRENDWQPEYFFDGDMVHFASIDLTLSIADIYDGVNLKTFDKKI